MVKTLHGRKPGARHAKIVKNLRHRRRMAAAAARHLSESCSEEEIWLDQNENNELKNMQLVPFYGNVEDAVENGAFNVQLISCVNRSSDSNQIAIPLPATWEEALKSNASFENFCESNVKEQSCQVPEDCTEHEFSTIVSSEVSEELQLASKEPQLPAIKVAEIEFHQSEEEEEYDDDDDEMAEIRQLFEFDEFDEIRFKDFVKEINDGLLHFFTFLSISSITTAIFLMLLLLNATYFQYHQKIEFSNFNNAVNQSPLGFIPSYDDGAADHASPSTCENSIDYGIFVDEKAPNFAESSKMSAEEIDQLLMEFFGKMSMNENSVFDEAQNVVDEKVTALTIYVPDFQFAIKEDKPAKNDDVIIQAPLTFFAPTFDNHLAVLPNDETSKVFEIVEYEESCSSINEFMNEFLGGKKSDDTCSLFDEIQFLPDFSALEEATMAFNAEELFEYWDQIFCEC
jgi:hypothetical protein